MRFAYADPPYIGQAKKHYSKEATYAGEVDHAQLVVSLQAFDGWALSASSPSLPVVLGLCPPGVRIGAWVKPFCSFKPGVNPAYAWEPVIFFGGRKRDRTQPTVRDYVKTDGEHIEYGQPEYPDWVSANITLKKGLSGAKPEAFCRWLFDLLGLLPEDEFIDLFPGTGIVSRTWETWKAERVAA